jgi:hypothetical protein
LALSALLFGGYHAYGLVEGQDVTGRPNGRLTALLRVSPGYFDAIGMSIGAAALMCAMTRQPWYVVNETMAKRLWPGRKSNDSAAW